MTDNPAEKRIASTASMLRVAINTKYTGKMPKGATLEQWGAFNDSFQTKLLTVDQLITEIQKGHSFTVALKPNARRKAENFTSAQHIALDFDTCDERSSLDCLAADEFIGKYATFLYTSPSHTPEEPRARAVFILDKQIDDPVIYGQYVQALVNKYGMADKQAKAAAQLWFASKGCEVRKLGGVLPIQVLEQLPKATVVPAVKNNYNPTANYPRNATKWLDQYLAESTDGTSDATGFKLATELRDDGFSDAEILATCIEYGHRATCDPAHPFTEQDARRWLKSARSKPARPPAEKQSSAATVGRTPPDSQAQAIGPGPGAEEGEKKKIIKSAEYVNVLKSLDYTFRMNQCSDRIEVNGEPISDAVDSVISSKLRDRGYPQVNVARDAYVAEAYYNSYHPIRDYLARLPAIDTGHIHQLAGYFDNPDGTFEPWLRRWLIGAIRRAIEPGEQNRVLVIDGPQNIGKSKFTEWLAPPDLRGKHYKSGPIYPDDKDCKIALTERWIWEVAELGSTTRRADREALKFFISLELVTMRPPYGRYEIQKPALANFIGTVNNENGLLSDPTGNRRYMFSKIRSIDWHGYTRNIDVNNIWAEALLLYNTDEPADLTPEEAARAEEINKTYQVEEPLEGILLQHFEIDPGNLEWWVSTAEILTAISNSEPDPFTKEPTKATYHGNTAVASMKLASLMTELGCERARRRPGGKHTNQQMGYLGVRRL